MVGRLAGAGLRRRRRHQRAARGPCCGRTAARQESALEEATPFGVELVEQLLPMQFKLRAVVIVPCAHDANSSLLMLFAGWKATKPFHHPPNHFAIVMPIASP